MATNRADTLDPALLRPGRLDRKIEFPVPDRRQKRLVFSTVTSKMNLSDEVDLEDYVSRPDHISGADINSICQEVRPPFAHRQQTSVVSFLGWHASGARKSLHCLGQRLREGLQKCHQEERTRFRILQVDQVHEQHALITSYMG